MNPTSDLYDELAAAAAQNAPGEVAALLASAPAVLLYGAGGMGRSVLRLLRARGVAVRAFLDRSARPGDERDGVPVLPPDAPEFGPEARQDTPVLLTVFNYQVDEAALRADLGRLGWSTLVPFTRLHRDFAAALGDQYWLTDPKFYADRAAEMRAASQLWADERSRAIYDAVLRRRCRGEESPALSPDVDSAYFPADVPPWKAPARFVDCGAYEGDTLEDIRARRFPLAAVAAFEPDPGHLPQLAGTLRGLVDAAEADSALLWPCAVHSCTTSLRFAAGLGTSSGVSAEGNVVVPAVALDDVLSGFNPTLIKMDIEGAEPDALLGARETIRRHRPGLAVCTYHRPDHLWQIPLLIQGWNLGYRFWLRLHAHSGYEMVLYAQAEAA